jgi:hypothetical protein
MANRPWLEEVRKRLVRHGLPPAYVQRFVAELADHFHDLKEETMSSEADVCSRLGEPEQVADAALVAYRRRSFLGRHPIAASLVFVVSPVASLLLLFALCSLGLALFIQYPYLTLCVRLGLVDSSWKEIPGIPTAEAIAVGMLGYVVLLVAVVAPCTVVATLYCNLAMRLCMGGRWMVASCAVLAAVALVPGYYVRFADLSGHVTWPNFLMAHLQQLAQVLMPLVIAWWFMRRRGDRARLQLAS